MKRIIKRILKWVGIVLLGLMFIILALWLYLSVRSGRTYALPKPTGPYHVGRVVYDWTDNARTNAFVGKGNEKRELMAAVWYPTSQSSGATVPYLPAKWQAAAEQDQGSGALLKHKFARIMTNSYEDAKISDGSFPLVILQPGFGCVSFDYTAFAENLASHGYVVISSSPTYVADLVVFNDGRIVQAAPEAALPENVSGLAPATMQATAKQLPVWENDISFLIDQAEALNSGGSFQGKIDMNHIGVIGHSLGGAAAYQFCKTDARCIAAIDMDGTLYGDTSKPSLVPFMYLSSDHSKDQGDTKKEDEYTDGILKGQHQPIYHVTVEGTAHFNFSDLALYSYKPIMRLFGVIGPIDGQRGVWLANQYVEDMLNKYLKNQHSQYIDASRQQSGAMVQKYN